MKKRVAVLQFPGINSEYETRRALWDAGMDAEFFRWNQNPAELDDFDGFVIAGGFSYEDRGRAGLVASMDPVMREIAKQAAQGKPVLGICNGAQILVETGLVPGGPHNELLMCLARNKRVKNDEILGVGFYNENVHVKSTAPKGRCAFTLDFDPGDLDFVPVAHGEGRFTSTVPGLFDLLEERGQIPFKYCTHEGEVLSEFPVNPNGALHNAAAVCNGAGNVMAIMPHPERAPQSPMPKIFTSMRKYMEGTPLNQTTGPVELQDAPPRPKTFEHSPNSVELYVKLIITDNEAQTLENALRQQGFNIRLRKWVHYQVDHAAEADQEALVADLIASGELLNINKETADVVVDGGSSPHKQEGTHTFLVRDREDSTGASKLSKIRHHMGPGRVDAVHHGWFWEVSGEVNLDQLLATNVFANHHAQELFFV